MPSFAFASLSAVAVVAFALAFFAGRRPASSLLAFVVAVAAVAGIFALYEAHFLAVAEIAIAAGAAGAATLFAVLLLDRDPEARSPTVRRVTKAGVAVLVVAILAVLLPQLPEFAVTADPENAPARPAAFGTAASVGGILFTRFVLPLAAASLVLLVGVIGVVTLVRARGEES